MVEGDINLSRFLELATTNKQYVKRLNLHEIESGILIDFRGDFEMIGYMLIGEIEQTTNIRFRSVEDFEAYIHIVDVEYDSEDAIFTGWLYKLNTPHFSMVNRSQYGIGTHFKQDIVE